MSYNRGGDGKPRGFGFGGFQMSKREQRTAAIPPPPSSNVSKHGYSTMSAITQNAMVASGWGAPKKRAKTEDEYFEEDDESSAAPQLAYIPAPGSPSYGGNKKDSDSEEDPLDAFMAGIEQQVSKEKKKADSAKDKVEEDKSKGIRDDIDGEDIEESYYRYMEENPMAGVQNEDEDDDMEYDEDGNPIVTIKKKIIDPLPPIDHSTINYTPFEKNFYNVHEEISKLTPAQVAELRQKLGLKVTGVLPPHPVTSFPHFGFDDALIKTIRKLEYTQPTPIQAQAVPAALGGRDIIGIAKTGSGKTAAFIWPLLVHIMDQRQLKPGEGPIGLILAPTRELSQQIYNEAKRFGKVYGIQVCCCYGGGSKWEQSKALESGAEIVVATPGRMIDLVKMKATNLERVSFLVLDEADRMFDMGFEPQVRSICNHVRPDRQTLLFSATFKKRVEKLARDVLTDPVRIVQGDVGEANEDVTQVVLVLSSLPAKWTWLLGHIVEFLSAGSVLVFVTKKANAEELANNLRLKEYEVLLLHGDMDQIERNKVITNFKKQECNIMVATDVAARGLDIPHIRTVVNYDIARDIDTHTHRIGRTGRAGEKGTAYTLVTDKDKEFAGHLVRNLEGANQEVPSALLDLAMQSAWFRKSRFKGGKGKKLNIGGQGLGFRERPGLGSGDSGSSSSGGQKKPIQAASAYGSLQTGPAPSDSQRARGPGSDRLGAMRDAFRAQYMSQFTASEDTTWEKTMQKSDYGSVKPDGSNNSGNSRSTSSSSGGTTLSSGTYIAGGPPRSSSYPAPPSFVAASSSESSSRSDSRKKRSRWDDN
ncbi:ATP-dependent RNA helicase DDX42 [Frankliniella fusca]|uniref:ATP-dependent RNA helicase DDX42 n=1 Tax=Frankliniella fusca TaxID=407009 RepID=A0AAE1I100_9NEOP|nr:ATP-dependent RNA helicase DDX42 [Frankliniella fusca]